MNIEEASTHGQWTVQSRSPKDTERLGYVVGTCLEGGDVVALYGELGTGKTTLVRGLATGMGASPADVSSPTFVLIHEYHGRLRLAHADLYRVTGPFDLYQTGLTDYFDQTTVTVLEWAEKAIGELPADRLDIRLQHDDETTRSLMITARGPGGSRLLGRIRKALAEV